MNRIGSVSVLFLLGVSAIYAQVPASGAPAKPTPITADSKAPVVHAAEALKRPTAFWVENGKSRILRGAEVAKAPKNATVIDVEVFNLGGGQVYRKVRIPKGETFMSPKGIADTLVYVLKGKLHLRLGTVDTTVVAGDAYRKIAAQNNIYSALEDTVFIETDAPSKP